MNPAFGNPLKIKASESLVTSASLARIARALYTEGPVLNRALQHWRPYICPFDKVLEEIAPGAFVLDVGCGGGLLLGLAAHVERISGGVGFDYSRDAIEVATAMTRALGKDHRLSFRHLSTRDVWPQGPFTTITMIDVLHHIPRGLQREVFSKAARLVQPGAQLLVKDIAPRPRWRAAANTVHDLVLARQWAHYVTLQTLSKWARDEGLSLARAYRLDRLWYGHQFAVFTRPH